MHAVATFIGVVLVIAACGSGSADTTTTTSSTVPATVLDPGTSTTTTTAPTTTTTAGPAPVASLQMIKVQQHLTALGYFDGVVDGVLGPVTAASLEAFQSDAGITADGKWGPETEAALAAAVADDEEFVLEIQARLTEAGLYSGPEDGDYGSGTRDAVEDAQEQCELEVNGAFTALTDVCLDELLEA